MHYSVRTPNTFGDKSVYSKAGSVGKELRLNENIRGTGQAGSASTRLNQTQHNWGQKRGWFNNRGVMREDGRTEIYSKYSKGRDQLNRSDYEAVADKLSQNEFISSETF